MTTSDDPSDFHQAGAMVRDWLEFAQVTRRKKSPREIAPRETQKYLELEVAWVLHRLKDHAAADSLAAPVLESLKVDDPVERALGRVYEHRINEAKAGAAPELWPTESLRKSWEHFTGMQQYFVEAALDVSYVLSPTRVPSATAQVYEHHLLPWIPRPTVNDAGPATAFSTALEELPAVWWDRVAPGFVASATGGLGAVEPMIELAKAYWPR
ncbi:MAG: hypothetical protein QM723_03550 [Myxococcaceae bacterium]